MAKYDAEQRGEPVGDLPLSTEQGRIRELERENQQLEQDVAASGLLAMPTTWKPSTMLQIAS